MTYRSFRCNYHDGSLVKFELGPRCELRLDFDLDPVWNQESSFASVRFDAIENFEDVKKFFQGLPKPPESEAYIGGVIGLKYVGEGPNWVVLDLADYGDIIIRSEKVTEL